MTMASLNKNTVESDEEDDLESLRLAALKSLKPKSATEIHNKPPGNGQCKPLPLFNNKPSTFGAAQTTRHHNRGFRSNPGGRLGRNGINSRIRTNTNLISIQTIDPDEPKEVKVTPPEIPKLILPQDRYHKPLAAENTTKESSGNKFDRYDNSDDSESDSDELATKSSRRERKNSVELLMDEIENEINLLDGKEVQNEEIEETKVEEEEETPTQSDTLIISETDIDLVQIDEPSSPFKEELIEEPPPKKSRSRSPYSEKSQSQKRKSKSRSRSPYAAQYKSPYRSPRSRSPPRKRYSPTYPRALSPLSLNTEVLNTITMAPLSPRSAAFVLENRQILARRQMSPRRTLSRESSCRRSLTPKPRRRSRSPVKRSISPRRRSLSPRNNHRNKKRSPSPVNKIHKRLGSRPNSRNVSPYVDRKSESGKRKRNSRSISLSLSPSPDRNYHKRPLNETTGHLEPRSRKEKRKESPKPEKPKEDPILEARRRKFETPVPINNGIIKLKTSKPEEEIKDVKETEKADTSEEDLEDTEGIIDLNPNLDDLWTDEETDDENEGRFKSKPSSENKKIPVPSFRKLTERPIPNSLLPKDDNDRRDRKYKRQRRRRSRTPIKSTKQESKKEPEKEKPKPVDNKVRIKPEEEKKEKITLKSESKKSAEILKPLQFDKNVKRKVKIQEVPETTDENKEGIEVVENKETTTNKEDDAGDLRAELSRRRAQRLIKAGNLAESLPTRLLKNALQEVVPKRSPVRQAKVAKGTDNAADRRVLILKRLASSPEPANKVGSKEGKLPIHMRLGSNPDGEEPVAVRSERRNKRRTNRRKKPVQV